MITERELKRICFDASIGMSIDSPENCIKLNELGYIRFIVWRTKRLMKMFDWMLK